MTKPIRSHAVILSDVTEALELMPAEWSAYVNRRTGEVVSLSADAFAAIDAREFDEDTLGEADESMIALAREIERGTDFEKLPNKFEIDEGAIMHEFCETVKPDGDRQELRDAVVQGRGASRFFSSSLDRLGLKHKWNRYRNHAIEQFAIDWLEDHNFPWKRSDSEDGIMPD